MTNELEKNAKIKSINAAVKFVDSRLNPLEVKLKPDFYNENLLHHKGKLGFLTNIPLASIIVANITPGCAMCFSKDIKEEFLETYDFTLPHDWHLNLLASIHGGCFFMNKVLVMADIRFKERYIGFVFKNFKNPSLACQKSGINFPEKLNLNVKSANNIL